METKINSDRESSVTGHPPIAARSAATAWEVRLLWVLVLVLLGYWAYGQVRNRIDPEVHRRVLALLRQRYPNHAITLQAAHVIEGKAIVLDGLRVSLPGERGLTDVLRLGRVTALGKMTFVDLVSGQLNIDEIKLDDLTVSLWPMQNGAWSIETMFDSGPLPESLPPLTINSGILRLLSDSAGTNEVICHDLKARCRLNKTDASLQETPYEIQAKVRSAAFDLVSIYLNVSRDKAQWNINGNVVKCRFTQALVSQLSDKVRSSLDHLAGFDGELSSTFAVKRPRDGKLSFEVNGDIHNGSLVHPRLPYPLERLAGRIYCRNDILQLRDAKASSGSATFKMDADVYGANAELPIVLELQAQNLPIDDRLYKVLTPKLKEVWQRLQPAGVADGTIRLQFDGTRWRPEIEADIRDGRVRFANFPYPVTEATGHISCNDQFVRTSNFRGQAGNAEASLVLLMQKKEGFWSYDATIATKQAVKIDEELLSALTERGEAKSEREKFIRSLHPTGFVHIKHAKFIKTSADEPPFQSLKLEIRDGSIAYDQFRYPVFGIHGDVSIVNNKLSIDSLRGHNDSANVHCFGQSTCGPGRLSGLQLTFTATSVPLEEELRLALPVGTRQLWEAVQPSGVVDEVTIRLDQPTSDSALDLAVTIEEQPNVSSNARSVTVRPREIPYPLTDIRCHIEYRNGIAKIDHMSGVHDVSNLSATGEFAIASDGTWNGTVNWLPESRLIVDQSLLSCLPGYLQQPILNTAFRGPISVMGQSRFASSSDGSSLVMRDWSLDLAIEEGRLGWGDIASGIRGSVQVVGSYDDVQIQAMGKLRLDSLSIYSIPVLNLTGPFAVQDGNIYFGRDSKPAVARLMTSGSESSPFRLTSSHSTVVDEIVEQVTNPASSDSATANALRTDPNFLRPADDPQLAVDEADIFASCFGGRLAFHGVHEIFSTRSRLGIQLQEADLQETLMDLSRGAAGVRGKYWAECSVQGSLHNQQTLVGTGQAWLRRADLVQMPVMSRLFRTLSIRDPKSGAFESGELQFRIDGDRIPLDKISLDGDIISLRGSGWVNLRHEIDLDLFAYVGKRSVVAAVLGPIVSHNDNASLMAVEVDGTLAAMDIRRSFNLINPNAAELFPERLFNTP